MINVKSVGLNNSNIKVNRKKRNNKSRFSKICNIEVFFQIGLGMFKGNTQKKLNITRVKFTPDH